MRNDFIDSIKYEITDTEKEILYRRFVETQRTYFEKYINFLNAELCVLKRFGIVSSFSRFLARIKSVESSIKNDEKKALNDIFGIEIDTATLGEYAFIAMLLKDTLMQTRVVIHNRTNEYVAYHYSGYPKTGNIAKELEKVLDTTYDSTQMFEEYMASLSPKKKEKMNEEDVKRIKEYCELFCNDLNKYIYLIKKTLDSEKLEELKEDLEMTEKEYRMIESDVDDKNFIPIIEAQLKSIGIAIEANIGSSNHGDYKGVDIKEIQKEYDSKGGIPLSRLPIMYKSTIETDERGIPIPPKILSSDETAKVLYPSLVVKKKGQVRGGK